jgi:hypothetical protein
MILVSSRTRTYSEEITVKVFAILGCAAIFTAACQADVVVYDNIELDNTGAVTNTAGQISIASGGPLYNSFTSTTDGTLTGLSLVLDSPQLDPIFDIVLYANTNTNTPGAAIATLATVSDALIGLAPWENRWRRAIDTGSGFRTIPPIALTPWPALRPLPTGFWKIIPAFRMSGARASTATAAECSPAPYRLRARIPPPPAEPLHDGGDGVRGFLGA